MENYNIVLNFFKCVIIGNFNDKSFDSLSDFSQFEDMNLESLAQKDLIMILYEKYKNH